MSNGSYHKILEPKADLLSSFERSITNKWEKMIDKESPWRIPKYFDIIIMRQMEKSYNVGENS